MAYASIDDINAVLPAGSNTSGAVVKADDVNTDTLAISAERVIRGYLARVVPTATMASWDEPASTPEIITEIAALLIGSQLYFNQTAASDLTIEERHVSQVLYDRAMKLLQDVLSGVIEIPDITFDTPQSMELEDFFPIDDTDRAFTLGMQL